jgi:hypothetical protein
MHLMMASLLQRWSTLASHHEMLKALVYLVVNLLAYDQQRHKDHYASLPGCTGSQLQRHLGSGGNSYLQLLACKRF